MSCVFSLEGDRPSVTLIQPPLFLHQQICSHENFQSLAVLRQICSSFFRQLELKCLQLFEVPSEGLAGDMKNPAQTCLPAWTDVAHQNEIMMLRFFVLFFSNPKTIDLWMN